MSQPPCATYSGGHEWVLAAVHNLNADFKFQCWKGTNLFHLFQVLFLATFLYERSSLWTCRIIHPWSSAWVQHYSMLHPQWLLHSLSLAWLQTPSIITDTVDFVLDIGLCYSLSCPTSAYIKHFLFLHHTVKTAVRHQVEEFWACLSLSVHQLYQTENMFYR